MSASSDSGGNAGPVRFVDERRNLPIPGGAEIIAAALEEGARYRLVIHAVTQRRPASP